MQLHNGWSTSTVRIKEVSRKQGCADRLSGAPRVVNLTAVSVLILLLCVFSLAGCTGNVVNISFPSLQEEPSPETARNILVCVVDFKNKRGVSAVGKRKNGESLQPRMPVERWMMLGLARELIRSGFHVNTVETMDQALASGAKYIITGEAEEAWLEETSLTRYTASIRASLTLHGGTGVFITRNAYNSVYSTAFLPVYGPPQDLMDKAFLEMLHPAVRHLGTLMR